MANIKASLITLVGNPSLLRTYEDYINAANETSRNKLQQKLEKSLGEQVFGAKKVAGDPKLIPDWFVSEYKMSEEIVKNLGMFEIDADGQLRIEAKLQRKDESSATRTTIGTSKLFTKAENSIVKEIIANTGRKETVNINNTIYNFLRRVGNKQTRSSDLFNYLEKNAPISVHNPAYQKSKNLVIFSKAEGSLLAYNIFFPRSKFKTPIFGVTLGADKTLSYVLQTSFEKTLVKKLQDTYLDVNNQILDEQRSLVSKLEAASSKSTSITFGDKQKGRKTKPRETIDIIYYTTNSMPMSKAKIKMDKKLTYNPVQGPSLVDITVAVRGRTRLRMRRGSGNPRPPKIYERSGDFRSSIEAVADLRANTIQYFYTPYYKRLERYGYEIDELVEGSIRSIAQAQFKRRFNLIRRNT
jgi:hypothetical protein